ncbi:MAG: 6-bladed beta-propeller [Gemmatimonadetes bacterium]|nr:6-bladed beta-propeller [Gemmatimonadota bacterium]
MSRAALLPPGPLLVAITALTGACDQRLSSASDLTTTVDTVAGLVHVTNAGIAPEWRLVPVVSIGPKELTDQATPDEFGGVSAVAFGPDEALFVADEYNSEVRVFGLDGAHRRTFGREGDGPGEFRSLYSLAWVGDRLLTLDPRLGRVGEFSAQGEWLGQRTTVMAGFSGSPAFIRFFPVGPNEVFRFAYSLERETIWVGHHATGDTGDTVPGPRSPVTPLPGAIPPMFCEADGATGFFGAPFAPGILRHPASGGIAYSAWGYFYRIAVTDAAGDTLRVIERTLPTEPISDDEWAGGRSEEQDVFRERFPNASCNPRTFTRPDRKPFIDEIFVAPDGKLWVDVIRTAGNRWEFFDAEGGLVGSVPAVPYKDRTVPVFRGDYLATIRQDELELDHVDVWRLERIN